MLHYKQLIALSALFITGASFCMENLTTEQEAYVIAQGNKPLIRSDLTDIKGRLHVLEQSVKELTIKSNILEGQLVTAEGNIEKLKRNVNTQTSDIEQTIKTGQKRVLDQIDSIEAEIKKSNQNQSDLEEIVKSFSDKIRSNISSIHKQLGQ